MNDEDKMTIDEWNETRILVDEYVEELDRKQLSASLEPKTPREIELRKLASILYEHATKIEPEITDDIREISNITNGQMLGKKNLKTGLIKPSHVLKEKHGLERKILADSEAYHGDLVDAMKGIRDSVRYTIIFDDDYYVAGLSGAYLGDYYATIGLLEEANHMPQHIVIGVDPWAFMSAANAGRHVSINDFARREIERVSGSEASKYTGIYNDGKSTLKKVKELLSISLVNPTVMHLQYLLFDL